MVPSWKGHQSMPCLLAAEGRWSHLRSGHAVAQHRQAGVARHRHCKDSTRLNDVPVCNDMPRRWLHIHRNSHYLCCRLHPAETLYC